MQLMIIGALTDLKIWFSRFIKIQIRFVLLK